MAANLDRPTMVSLLRIAVQSFDAGGESMRSLRAQAIETVLHSMIDVDDPAFSAAFDRCDRDPWEFLAEARRAVWADTADQGKG